MTRQILTQPCSEVRNDEAKRWVRGKFPLGKNYSIGQRIQDRPELQRSPRFVRHQDNPSHINHLRGRQ